MSQKDQDNSLEGIAIVGMAGRFPGADSVEEFWVNLKAGVESITFFTDEEVAASGPEARARCGDPDYVKARGILKDPENFDAAFFGMTPREAEVTDPQHRLFLESAWTALENAGYDAESYRGLIGVFGGMSTNTYVANNLAGHTELVKQLAGPISFGNEKDYLTTRVSYKLNLRGPSLNVYTACSTSLVAVCLASQNLLSYQCDLALAGGVSVRTPQHEGYPYSEGGIASPDGHTRTFDAKGKGTVFSNGVGIVVLKRLSDAVADGDTIHAVIRGVALNNDGAVRVSFGAPGVEGQAEVIALAQAMAGFSPETISCIEAHGTATPLGDPIEIEGLTQAFRQHTEKKNFCAIGSVKTNLGHLDAAAGVAGLIKTALSLRDKTLVPSLHFEKPNPKIDLANSPFYVNTKLMPWPDGPTPRRAGVSSFGTGGTNAHVVVEEPPVPEASGPSRPWQLLVLSAKTATALEAATANLAKHLRENPDINLTDAAFTLKVGRRAFNHRRVAVCRDASDAVAALSPVDAKRVFTREAVHRNSPVVFMFPGQGAQYVGMGRELYDTEPGFKADVDRCAEILRPEIGLDLREVLYPTPDKLKWAEETLIQTRVTQPALFVIEYALAQLWMSWGIRPAAMIGHSVGEYVAGCLAGVFSLKDGLKLVANRARLVQEQPGGAMLAVRLSEDETRPLLGNNLSIAAVNAPASCVVSGPYDAVEALEKMLKEKGVASRRLHTSHAFHSAMMDPVIAPFTELLKKTRLQAPQIPYVSNVTAKWINEADATNPDYWAGHVRQAVRFADGVAELFKDSRQVLLEVGPGTTLSALAKQHPEKKAEQTVVASVASSKDGSESAALLTALGKLWQAGATIDWPKFYGDERRRRIPLPTYPFERKRCWIEPVERVAPAGAQQYATAPASARADAIALSESSVAAATAGGASTEVSSEAPRVERIIALLKKILHDLSGVNLDAADPRMSFMEMGFDSLFLTQASQAFQNKLRVKITFRQLLEDLPTLGDVAAFLDQQLPPDALPATPPAAALPQPAAAGGSVLEQMQAQLQALTKQMEQLARGALPSPAAEIAPVATSKQVTSAVAEPKSFGPFKPIERESGRALTPQQREHLDALIGRYTRRTAGSRRLTELHRPHYADARTVAGFNPMWKEMVYPIISVRSDGSKIEDVDGNEYIDFVMGFGANVFGHRPDFVIKAVKAQLDLGVEIGPQSPLAGKVAKQICDFTGMERAAFCNTGSEAVATALRVARTVTGRSKVVVFNGDYHGMFDEVLVRSGGDALKSVPIAPGIPDSSVASMIVLEWNSPKSLEVLRSICHEVAAVMVEPIQGRRVDVQPREFLKEIRRITEDHETALIFDEIIFGFRLEPGGAQAWYDIKADLATYGKVLGGGFPIGVVTGSARFMDALDGGQWHYGDDSFPEVGVTFFAGTFVRHPAALAAAHAVLNHLKERGPDLQRELNERAARLTDEINAVTAEAGVPIKMVQFSSVMNLRVAPELKHSGLLYYHLREKGVHCWENRSFMLTTAHTDEDLKRFVQAFKESIEELQAGGFFPAASAPAEPVTAPLSEAQKEVWVAAQLGDDASRAFNEAFFTHLHGDLRRDVLHQCLQELVNRHDALRTTFAPDGAEQRIAPSLKLELPLIDLSDKDAAVQERELAELAAREEQTSFDLIRGPLFRMKLIRLAEQHHALHMIIHHVVVDGWSWGVLMHEMGRLYEAGSRGMAVELEPALQFKDYIEWHGQPEQVAEQQRAEAFWLKQFADPPTPVELPSDRPRPARKTYRAAQTSVEFDAGFYRQLKQASGKLSSTLFNYLFAAFNTWLHRVTGQHDLVVGVPAAGQIAASLQSVPGSRKLVGHCVNLLPIRTRCAGDIPFKDLLKSVKGGVLDSYEHQNFTFGSLVQKLNLPRDPSRTPLVSVLFNLDRAGSSLKMEGLQSRIVSPPRAFNFFDLMVNVVDTDKDLRVECKFNTDLFDAATIQRWLAQWRALLEGIIAAPETPLAGLPVLPEAERRRLLVEWNDTALDYPKEFCVHQLIEAQVERTPDQTAIVAKDRSLTFAELNGRANRLAHYLRKQSVGPDTLVGVGMERTSDLIIGLLGVHKAGGAYVPLDPDYPKDRLAYILRDARMPVLLTQSKLTGLLPDLDKNGQQTRVICLDADWSEIACENAANPENQTRPENLSHAIYTSGSTGRPKGVGIEHRNVNAFLQWAKSVFTPDQLKGVLASTSVCFDLSVYEIFTPLSRGGTIYLADNALELPSLPAREKVTLINTVPSAIAELLRVDGIPSSVSVVNLAGEPLSREIVDQLYAKPHIKKVYDLYGPTEDTVYSTFTLRQAGAPATIGRPLANKQVYLLDAQRQPVPIGVPGEIYIGGDCVARGYLNQPELTAEKFIADPFSDRPGARLYRTGDLARYRADGNLEFLGRIDHQIKIRGYRIELGEIESVLRQHPQVGATVVVAREDTPGDKRLVAYLVAKNSAAPAAGELREHLRARLPDYMVPSVFVTLEELPLTPNGKVDRRALPAPDHSRPELEQKFVAPRTPMEELLAGVWKQVLQVERVGVHDNFFDLGGHSLLATRVITRVNQAHSLGLSLALMFEQPTIAGLAAALTELQMKNASPEELARLLAEVEGISEAEAAAQLAGARKS